VFAIVGAILVQIVTLPQSAFYRGRSLRANESSWRITAIWETGRGGFTFPLHPLATQIGGERNRGAGAISVRDAQPPPAAILSS